MGNGPRNTALHAAAKGSIISVSSGGLGSVPQRVLAAVALAGGLTKGFRAAKPLRSLNRDSLV